MTKPFRNFAIEVIQAKTAEEMTILEGKATQWWQNDRGMKVIARLPDDTGFEAVRFDTWTDAAAEPKQIWAGPFGEFTLILVFGAK